MFIIFSSSLLAEVRRNRCEGSCWKYINEIIERYEGKRIAIVSHGGAIKFYLLSYCKVNENLNLEYKGQELTILSPCLLKLIFRKNKLVSIEQISL